MEQKSIMWDYIAQEPGVLKRLLASGQAEAFAREVGRELDAVYFVAHGSSYNAATAVSDFMSRYGGLRVYAYTPANFQFNASALKRETTDRTLVAAISQTGTSSGAIDALHCASDLGFRTLGITDVRDSPIAREATYTLLLGCGEENSNAKTKGYSATLMLLILLALELGRVKKIVREEQRQSIHAELADQIDRLPEIAHEVCEWCRENQFGTAMKDLYVLGYGMNFGTAMEGQLKLMETMCIPTMFNDIVEFSHGMHRSVTEKSTVLLLRTAHPLQELTEKTFLYLQNIGARTLMLDAAGGQTAAPGRLPIPAYPNTQSILLMTLAVQVLSVFGPEQLGDDPNRNAHNDFTEVVHTRV